MAPKKAAAKKAAKKGKKNGGKDLRRAYEHLHRVGVLHTSLATAAKRQVDLLSRGAQQALADGRYESAADLLRAAEHFAFGSMASDLPDKNLNQDLAEAAKEEYEHLAARASKHWDHHTETDEPGMTEIFHAALDAAAAAFADGAMYRALEYVRAADALADVEPSTQQKLKQPGKADKALRAAAKA